MNRSLLVPNRIRLSWLVSLIVAALLASGCMRTNIEMLTPVEYAPVDPYSVQVFAPSRREQAQHSTVPEAVAVMLLWAPPPAEAPPSPLKEGLFWGGVGAISGFVVGGLANLSAAGKIGVVFPAAPDPSHTCFDKNCALILAGIGAAAGFAIGAIHAATSRDLRETGERQRRADVAVVPLHNGSLGLGASVRF